MTLIQGTDGTKTPATTSTDRNTAGITDQGKNQLMNIGTKTKQSKHNLKHMT